MWADPAVNFWLGSLHLSSTLVMLGIIWFVQVVHYPLMAVVDPGSFTAYERAHQQLTTRVVAAPMLIEACSAAALLFSLPAARRSPLFLLACGLLVLIWISTACWQVPLHQRLGDGYDRKAIHRLVDTNWLRTICWSARGILLLAFWPRTLSSLA